VIRNVSNLLRHLSREISVVHRSYVNICHLIAVHNDRLAMVLATLYMEPLGPCFHEANGEATAALVASLPRQANTGRTPCKGLRKWPKPSRHKKNEFRSLSAFCCYFFDR
jgi:hypothetical protein